MIVTRYFKLIKFLTLKLQNMVFIMVQKPISQRYLGLYFSSYMPIPFLLMRIFIAILSKPMYLKILFSFCICVAYIVTVISQYLHGDYKTSFVQSVLSFSLLWVLRNKLRSLCFLGRLQAPSLLAQKSCQFKIVFLNYHFRDSLCYMFTEADIYKL